MKKFIVFLLVMVMLVGLFTGCRGNKAESNPSQPNTTGNESAESKESLGATSENQETTNLPSEEDKEPEIKWETKDLDMLKWLEDSLSFETLNPIPDIELVRMVSPLVFNEDTVVANIKSLDRYSNADTYKSFSEGGSSGYYDEWHSRIPVLSYKIDKSVDFAVDDSYVLQCSYVQDPAKCSGIQSLRISIPGIDPNDDVQSLCYETLEAACGEELAEYFVYAPSNAKSYENPNAFSLYKSQNYGSDASECEVSITCSRDFLYEYDGTWRVSFSVLYSPSTYKEYSGYHGDFVPLINTPKYTIEDVLGGRVGSIKDIFNASDALEPFFNTDILETNDRYVSRYNYSYRESPFAGPHYDYEMRVCRRNDELNNDYSTSCSFMFKYEIATDKENNITELDYTLSGQPTIIVKRDQWEETVEERNASFDKLLSCISKQVELTLGKHIDFSRSGAELDRDGKKETIRSEYFDLDLFGVDINTYASVSLEESGTTEKGIACQGAWYIYGRYRGR